MPVLPIRNLGRLGVITDVDPFNLPIDGFSKANNVRFTEGNIERSPVPRTAYTWSGLATGIEPRHITSVATSPSTIDRLIVVYNNFTIQEINYGSVIADTNDQYSTATATDLELVTSCSLAGVTYFNKASQVPIYRLQNVSSGQSRYDLLTNVGWNANWRAAALRSYGDFLLAINVTESNENFGTRVRWSDVTLSDEPPSNWTDASPSSAAGFNDLAEMRTPLIDGFSLGSNFILYSSDQVWQMEFVGGNFIFNFRKLFDDTGIINQNCCVEVDGRHYVFDRDDIYVHDGVSKQSICDGRVKDFIFDNINLSKATHFAVCHMPELQEVYFCYASGDDDVKFAEVDGCNKAAVYNYVSNTWSFIDLPNVKSITRANLGQVSEFDDGSTNYDETGATFNALDSKFRQYTIFLSKADQERGISATRMVGLDQVDSSQLALPLTTELVGSVFLERTGIDLDDVSQLPLSTYKNIKRVVPLLSTKSGNKEFKFSFGAVTLMSSVPSYGSQKTFDPLEAYKVDTRMGGRFLSYQMTTDDVKDFKFSGMDLEVVVTGKR